MLTVFVRYTPLRSSANYFKIQSVMVQHRHDDLRRRYRMLSARGHFAYVVSPNVDVLRGARCVMFS